MPRPTSAQSDQDDASDALLFEEHERLRNQIRILQAERQKETEETKVKLGKYSRTAELLDEENEEIKCLLALVDSAQNRKQDLKCIERLKEILKHQDELQEQIDELKAYDKRLNIEIIKLEKVKEDKHQERRMKLKNQKDAVELKAQVEKKILWMENNLHEKNSKFSETLAKNTQLRDEIEKARNERRIYSALHKKLNDKLVDLNRVKAKLTQHATVAYDTRSDAKAKAQTLKEKNDKDQAAYEIEIKDLQRVIDHNDQLRRFMAIKGDERVQWKQEAEERKRKYGANGEIAREQRSRRIAEFENAMTQIQQITQKTDVQQIVRYYKRNEDDNFTQFKYVTELNNQIESLQEDIANKHKAIAQCHKEHAETEKQRHAQMRRLEIQMNADKEIGDAAQMRVNQIHKVLDQIKSQIKQLAIKLGCDVTRIVHMLGGDGDQVTERNLMLYLSMLEQRVDELLSVKCYATNKGHVDDSGQDDVKGSLTLSFVETPKTKRDLAITLPTLIDEQDEDEEPDEQITSVRPLTQAELINRVTKELQRQEADQNTNREHRRIMSDAKRNKVKI